MTLVYYDAEEDEIFLSEFLDMFYEQNEYHWKACGVIILGRL